MTTANQLIKTEKSYVRTSPYGARNKFNGNNGQPWCGYFQSYCLKEAGLGSWISKCKNPYYMPTLVKWAKDNGYWKLQGKPGDLVIFDWNSNKSPDHVGMLIKKNGSVYSTVEGNTSSASQGNGGCVQVRYRESKWVMGFIRPPYKAQKTVSRKNATYLNTYPNRELPSLKKHSDGLYLGFGDSGKDVKRLQMFLNWYLGYGLKVDGYFGALTRRAVMSWQASIHFKKTGLFGEESLSKSKKVKK